MPGVGPDYPHQADALANKDAKTPPMKPTATRRYEDAFDDSEGKGLLGASSPISASRTNSEIACSCRLHVLVFEVVGCMPPIL